MKPIACLAFLPFLFLIGCSAYVPGYYYMPHPGLVDVPATQPSQLAPAQVLASVIGIRYPDKGANLPQAVEVRIRVENSGLDAVVFDQQSMELHSGDLVQFAAPIIDPPSQVRLEPGQSGIITVEFPFPNGKSCDQLNMSNLHLQWTVRVGDRFVKQSEDFYRSSYPDYGYDPYWDGYPHGYYEPYPAYGVVVIHRRW